MPTQAAIGEGGTATFAQAPAMEVAAAQPRVAEAEKDDDDDYDDDYDDGFDEPVSPRVAATPWQSPNSPPCTQPLPPIPQIPWFTRRPVMPGCAYAHPRTHANCNALSPPRPHERRRGRRAGAQGARRREAQTGRRCREAEAEGVVRGVARASPGRPRGMWRRG